VTEPVKSRDHTERMLKMFGCRVRGRGYKVSVKGPVKLNSPGVLEVPGDISSAAFFIAAGCILPDTKVVLKNVGLNPTRTGVIDILKKMGADIRLANLSLRGVKRRRSNLKEKDCFASLAMTRYPGEPCGDIIVRSSELKGVNISAKEVVRAIDEIPIIMVAACFAEGITYIEGIGELRVKETDRVRSMVTNLRKLGADINPLTLALSPSGRGKGEGVIIRGGKPLHSATVSSFGDHRTAMSMLIAGLSVKGVRVTGLGCINKSFPGFRRLLRALRLSQ
jgi:3-phosphoshikimate 1-carboxyvinyltransferase